MTIVQASIKAGNAKQEKVEEATKTVKSGIAGTKAGIAEAKKSYKGNK